MSSVWRTTTTQDIGTFYDAIIYSQNIYSLGRVITTRPCLLKGINDIGTLREGHEV
ncbi:MAG: hypothetical protein J7L25_05145 [Deltaproteobacteria bacterium]|nr:hypothetical protein [Candidatus Tharpella aukensis]